MQGLSTIPYNEFEDTFDGRTLFTTNNENRTNALSFRMDGDIRFRMSYLHDSLTRQETSASRATRNPIFDMENYSHDKFLDDQTSPASPHSRPASSYVKDRPYFLDKTTMTRLRQLLILGASSGAFPWYWNRKHCRIDKWSPMFEKIWVIQWFFVTIQTLFLTIFQFYSFFNRVSGPHQTYREVFMSSLSAYWYICAVYFNINMYIYKDQVI